jgi:UTP--glucose-1-phosphate uridylyltransferase
MIGNEPFFLMLPDDLFEKRELVMKEMTRIFERFQGSVVAVKRVAKDEVNRYGIIECGQISDRIYQITDLVEKPRTEDAPSDLAVMGRYVLAPEIFGAIRETPPGRNGEIQLTDALKGLLRRYPIYALEFDGERWDAGTLQGWLETTITLALREPDIGPKLADYLQRILQDFMVTAQKL